MGCREQRVGCRVSCTAGEVSLDPGLGLCELALQHRRPLRVIHRVVWLHRMLGTNSVGEPGPAAVAPSTGPSLVSSWVIARGSYIALKLASVFVQLSCQSYSTKVG